MLRLLRILVSAFGRRGSVPCRGGGLSSGLLRRVLNSELLGHARKTQSQSQRRATKQFFHSFAPPRAGLGIHRAKVWFQTSRRAQFARIVAMAKGSPAKGMFDVECPCCQAVLEVDPETQAVIAHTVPRNLASLTTWRWKWPS